MLRVRVLQLTEEVRLPLLTTEVLLEVTRLQCTDLLLVVTAMVLRIVTVMALSVLATMLATSLTDLMCAMRLSKRTEKRLLVMPSIEVIKSL